MSFILGVVLCAAGLAVIVMFGGNPSVILDVKAFILVVAGTAGFILVTCPFPAAADYIKTAVNMLKRCPKPRTLINQIIELVQTARREGVLALEGKIGSVRDSVLKKGIMLISDSADREIMLDILSRQADAETAKEKAAHDFIERVASAIPIIGMIGTLVEIVQMLYTYKGPQMLAPGIAKALLPLVYSMAAAYLVLMPLAARVKEGSVRRQALRELAVQGVMALQAGEPQHIVEQRMSIYLNFKKHATD